MEAINFQQIEIQNIKSDFLKQKEIKLYVLRLDKIHPIISGNKSFKLRYYLMDARNKKKNTIATFGGAWSNHIVATAFACYTAGLQSIGFIRGDELPNLSHTLELARKYKMKLIFVSRENYKSKEALIEKHKSEDWYWIPEGGFGKLGAKGASEIFSTIKHDHYSHIIAAVGSGTMLAGLTQAIHAKQKVIGISCMKGNTSLSAQVKSLINNEEQQTLFEIIDEYHFGGFGKHPPNLIDFMNETYRKHTLPLDIVYTSKTFYGVMDLIQKGFFSKGSQLLVIHSGGLQGNMSLGDKLLTF